MASTAGRTARSCLIEDLFSDTAAGVHITALESGGAAPDEWIDVAINFGSGDGNAAPTATLLAGPYGSAREPLTFSVDASDTNGDQLAYYWDFGDGSISDNQPSQTRSWLVGGTYTISVIVSDMKGGTVTRRPGCGPSRPAR